MAVLYLLRGAPQRWLRVLCMEAAAHWIRGKQILLQSYNKGWSSRSRVLYCAVMPLFCFYFENDDIYTNNNDKTYEDPLIDDKKSIKVAFLGDSVAWKTSILERLTRNYFEENRDPSIAPSYDRKTFKINGREYLIDLWDTAGIEIFRSLAQMYCRNSKIAYFMFDLSKRSSFDRIRGWLEPISYLNIFSKIYWSLINDQILIGISQSYVGIFCRFSWG